MQPPPRQFNGFWTWSALVVLFALVLASPVRAQDRTVLYNIADPGVSKPIPTWGLDTAWLNEDNVRRGVIFMGQPRVDVIRFSFTADRPLTNGNLNASALAEFNARMTIVNTYTAPNTPLYLNNDSDFIDPYYTNSSGTIATNWANLINVTRSNCVAAGHAVLSVAPFNEPDFGTVQGNIAKLGEISWYIRTNGVFGSNFTSIRLCGGSTLNTDQASVWYSPLSGILDEGNTHQLAGSFDNYAAFYQSVQTNGDLGANDELHNVMEAMVGAEYGMDAGIWWGSAERARGEFVKASDGQRLAYAEHRPNWTAATVYRGTNGAVQAFVGESERQALPTTYRFFSKDRDVFYDGNGPRRDYTATTTGGPGYQTAAHRNAERVVNITWGADVPPPISGRYIVVNQNSGKVMEVPGASTNNGVVLAQANYTGASNQLWDVYPVPDNFGGDVSYYSMAAAHSGKLADESNFSYNDGSLIIQWNGGTNVVEQWYFEYVSNGYFKIRNRWSNKVVGVSGASTSAGAQILQWSDNGTTDHLWRLIPVGASPTDLTAPATLTGVTATANALSVQLNWNASAPTNTYSVLRGTNSGGSYDTVARGLTNNTFTDKSANQNKTYYYVVKATDPSLNTSGNSAQVNATPTFGPALVARYAFDGNTNDSSGNANHPIVTAGSPTFVTGKYGSAMDLSGTGQYTMLPANMLASVTNFTIAMWVNWDGGGNWQRIFDFGNGTSQYMFLSPSSGSGTLRFAVTTNGGGAEQILETSPLPVGQWRHVAITRNGNAAKLYTNGVVAATNITTIAPANFNPVLNNLGASQYADPLFNGRLDEFFIYNVALSAAEITQLMSNQPPSVVPTGLAATPGLAQVALTWSSSAGATSYNLKRSTNSGGPYTTVATGIVATNFTDTGLSNATTYFYVVSASTAVGESVNSAQSSTTTLLPVPPPPAGLTAAAGDAQVALNWSPAPYAASYNVKRSTTNGGPYMMIAGAVGTTNFTDTILANGIVYYYVVTSTNASGESGNSTQASAMPVSTAPPQLVFGNNGGALLVSWPADHLGWRLQSQTNGLNANWFDVPGSTATNLMTLPVDATQGSVFYRMIYP